MGQGSEEDDQGGAGDVDVKPVAVLGWLVAPVKSEGGTDSR